MALPAFMKKAFSRDGGDTGNLGKKFGKKPVPSGAAGRLAALADKKDGGGDGGGKGKKPPFQFGKKKGKMQAAALRMDE